MVRKVDIDSELPIHAEPEIVDKLELEVDESEPEPKLEESEVKESLIETIVDLPVEPTMELVPSLTAISLRSLNVYDPLQIFLQKT